MLVYIRMVDRLSGSESFLSIEYNVCGINSNTNDKPVISGNTSSNDIIYILEFILVSHAKKNKTKQTKNIWILILHQSSTNQTANTHILAIAMLQCFYFTHGAQRNFAMFCPEWYFFDGHHFARCQILCFQYHSMNAFANFLYIFISSICTVCHSDRSAAASNHNLYGNIEKMYRTLNNCPAFVLLLFLFSLFTSRNHNNSCICTQSVIWANRHTQSIVSPCDNVVPLHTFSMSHTPSYIIYWFVRNWNMPLFIIWMFSIDLFAF